MTRLNDAVVTEADVVLGRSQASLAWRRFRRDRAAMFGLALVVTLVALALLAPVISALVGHGPNDLYDSLLTPDLGLPKGPSLQFWFGGDQVGRDVFIRTIYGARASLTVALAGTAAAIAIGTMLGMCAGYFGGKTDLIISRVVDIFLALPLLLFAIGLSSVCSVSTRGCLGGLVKPGLGLVIGIIALFSSPFMARVVRGQVITLKQDQFVEAARSLGAGNMRILFREILPNLSGPLIVLATLSVPANILFEAALSFIGVGVPQSTPSWGRMLADATSGSLFTYAWWMMVFPGTFLLATTLGFNLAGDGLSDAMNTRVVL